MNFIVKYLLMWPIKILIVSYEITHVLLEILTLQHLKKKKDISGRNVLITGAGSVLGRELAFEFSKYSVSLILVDINKGALLETKKILGLSNVFTYVCDVSNNEMLYKMAKDIKNEVGDVDIVVNNAGIVQGKCLMDSSDEQMCTTWEVNVLSHLWTSKAFLPAMIKQNKGHIVSIASVMDQMGGPQLIDYSAIKFAAFSFADVLEMELREKNADGVRITIICPYHIDTGLFDGTKLSFGPPITAENVAQEILHGVLTDKEVVYIPPWSGPLMVKEFLQRWMTFKFLEGTGDINGMNGFTGRTSSENGQNSNKTTTAY